VPAERIVPGELDKPYRERCDAVREAVLSVRTVGRVGCDLPDGRSDGGRLLLLLKAIHVAGED
jgi:hypothetical protein